MGRIPVDPVAIRERRLVDRELRSIQVDALDLGIIIVQDLQQLVPEILFSEKEENDLGALINGIINSWTSTSDTRMYPYRSSSAARTGIAMKRKRRAMSATARARMTYLFCKEPLKRFGSIKNGTKMGKS
jgi:hypothetical protein